MKRVKRTYSKEFHEFMLEYVPGHYHSEVAEEANRRFDYNLTAATVKAYCHNHHIISKKRGFAQNPHRIFSKEVTDYIYAHHKGIYHKDLAEKLNELFGTDFTAAQIKSFYTNHHLSSGLTGYFPKGVQMGVPIKKGEHRSSATEFKKGHVPANVNPVGTERVGVDGYLEVKVREHRSKEHPNTYEFKHRVVWEQHNGPIPEGMMVILLDGNKSNCSIENLALVTQAENQILNAKKLRFDNAEMGRTGVELARVMAKVNSLKR